MTGGALLLVTLSVAAGAPADEDRETNEAPALIAEINVQDRAPLAFILFSPSGETGRTQSSSMIRMVEDLVESHTDFAVQRIEVHEARGCEGRLGCIVRAVRTDYQREVYELPNGTVAPFKEHLEFLRERRISPPEILLVLSNLTGGGTDRLSITFVDTTAALQIVHEARRDLRDWERDAEREIFEHALLAAPERGKVREEDDTRRLFERYFTGPIRRRLEADGHWEPYGGIRIETSVAGAGVELDGTTVGVTRAGVTVLNGVRAGRHELSLVHPKYRPFSTEVTAARGDVVSVTARLEPGADDLAAGVRQGLVWGGIGVTLAGATLTALAIAGQDDGVVTYCLSRDDPCGGTRFTSTGFSPDAAPTFGDGVNSSGVLIGPLGYSLAAAGVTWTASTLLLGDDSDFPWIQILAGLAVGGVSYGLSAALD